MQSKFSLSNRHGASFLTYENEKSSPLFARPMTTSCQHFILAATYCRQCLKIAGRFTESNYNFNASMNKLTYLPLSSTFVCEVLYLVVSEQRNGHMHCPQWQLSRLADRFVVYSIPLFFLLLNQITFSQ